MSKDTEPRKVIPIKPTAIMWEIEVVPDPRLPEIELQWGWTAGMTEEDLENYADDAPRGYDSVRITAGAAERLRDKLNEVLANRREDE